MIAIQIEIQQKFDVLEQQRRTIETEVCGLDGAVVRWEPNAGTWSIQQIVEHLVLSDETVGCAQAADAVPPEATMFRVLPRAVRRSLVLSAFKRDAVLPLPSPAVDPSGTVPLPALLERWDKARAEMQVVLETVNESETRWSHPVLGPLNAVQMLTLEEAHVAYHTRQMERIPTPARTSPPLPQREG